MSQTVIITGASTGIGRATALLFAQKGWQVVATMRSPKEDFANQPNILCLRLDVTDTDSIQACIDRVMELYGKLDVVVNNAGYGLVGAFEAVAPEQIQRQFDTNVFGLMNVCRAVLPIMRQRRQGVIVNVASVGGRVAFPLYSLYHSSKWAVEGFSESWQYELRPFGIKVKIIEPGPIKTDFYARSTELAQKEGLTDYDPFIHKSLPKLKQAGTSGAEPIVVAKTIWRASTDGSWRLRYPADPVASQLLLLRRFLPDSWFTALMSRNLI